MADREPKRQALEHILFAFERLWRGGHKDRVRFHLKEALQLLENER